MVGDYDAGFHRPPAGYDPAYRGGRGGYGHDLVRYGVDYEPFGESSAPPGWPRFDGYSRRRLVERTDRRARGGHAGAGGGWGGERGTWRGWPTPGRVYRGYERREPYARRERSFRNVPPDYRRYLSEDEYGLGPGRSYDRTYQEDRFRRGPLGPRNALFGREGFIRYDREYDEQWW